MFNKKVVRNIIVALTLTAFTAGGVLSYLNINSNKEMLNLIKWEAFTPEDQRFSVKFPAEPVKSKKGMNIANTHIEFQEYSAEVKDSLYAVSYLDFPGKWRFLGTNKLLTKIFEVLVQQEQNMERVFKQELSKHNGYSALNYHYKESGKEVRGKLIIVGNTLYRISITAPPLAANEAVAVEGGFLDSFNVNG